MQPTHQSDYVKLAYGELTEKGYILVAAVVVLGTVEKVKTLMKENNISITSKEGRSAFLASLEYNKKEISMYFLQKGIMPSDFINDDRKPLSIASQHGHYDIVKLLLEKKAEINEKSRLFNGQLISDKMTPLIFATEFNQLEIVLFLVENKASVNEKSEQKFTALHNAVSNDNIKIVKVLLDQGADVHAIDNFGYAPHLLVKDTKTLNLLRKAGANLTLKENGFTLQQRAKFRSVELNSEIDKKISDFIDLKKCLVCEKTYDIKLCGRCKKVYYCGREHQTSDWKNHKDKCKDYLSEIN